MSLIGSFELIKRDYFSHEKEGNPVICDNTDKPEGRYAELNKPDRAKCCMISLVCGI